MKRKKSLLILVLTGVTLLSIETSAKALQSIPEVTTLKSRTASDFFRLIRQMETAEGPMGLNAIVDNAGNETSQSNNIDVHMVKNTEWGTAAMLASSIYGSAKRGNVSYAAEKTRRKCNNRK